MVKTLVTDDCVMLWAACCPDSCMQEYSPTQGPAMASPPLCPSDVTVDSHQNPRLLSLQLRRSKTDLFGVGCTIYLGRTDTVHCPVAAVLSYLSRCPSTPGPLFIFSNGTLLTRAKLVAHVWQALSQAGIDCTHYSGHSFRIGAASAAAKAGYSDSFIQTLGCWKS